MAVVSALPQTTDSSDLGETANDMTLSDIEYATPNDVDLAKRTTDLTTERPAWMAAKMGKIGKLKVNQIAIPGTHHSGYRNPQTGLGLYTVCQSADIHKQLHMGIRWFDFRVAKDEYGMVFSHTIGSSDYVNDQLNVIKNYLNTYKSELVILHVTNDDGTEVHRNLLTTKMNEVFGNMIVNKNQYNKWSFKQLIDNGKRVIITGNYAPGNEQQRILYKGSWDKTQDYFWTNVVNDGINWLKTDGTGYINNGWIAFLEANASGPSPRNVAPYLNDKLQEEIAKLSTRINVISHDFAYQPLINTVIDHNDKF